MTKAISKMDDVIDSRDVIERIDELRQDPQESLSDEELSELADLMDLNSEGVNSFSDWKHGVVLVRDSYFKDYAQELADDLGLLKFVNEWPCNCIDWAHAAKELQYDYTAVEFDGITYWGR